MKNQKGITLIALVITIIVLLILAGITIAMLTGENGLLTKAGDSASKNVVASVKEEIMVNFQKEMATYLETKYTTGNAAADIDPDDLVTGLATKYSCIVEVTPKTLAQNETTGVVAEIYIAHPTTNVKASETLELTKTTTGYTLKTKATTQQNNG